MKNFLIFGLVLGFSALATAGISYTLGDRQDSTRELSAIVSPELYAGDIPAWELWNSSPFRYRFQVPPSFYIVDVSSKLALTQEALYICQRKGCNGVVPLFLLMADEAFVYGDPHRAFDIFFSSWDYEVSEAPARERVVHGYTVLEKKLIDGKSLAVVSDGTRNIILQSNFGEHGFLMKEIIQSIDFFDN